MRKFLALVAGAAVAVGAAALAAGPAPAARAAGMSRAGSPRGAARAVSANCPAEITNPNVVIKTQATVDYAFEQTCGATYGEWQVYGPSSEFELIGVPPGGFFDPDSNAVQYDFEVSQENRGLCVLEPDGLWDASGNPFNGAQATQYFYLKSGTSAGVRGHRSGGQAVLAVHVVWFGWLPNGSSAGGSWLPAGGREVSFWEKSHGAFSPIRATVRTDASGNATLRVPETWPHYFRAEVSETQRLWGTTSSPARI